MKREIKITKKIAKKGEDGHKVVSVRMKDSTIARLDELSAQTNRSRNELINMKGTGLFYCQPGQVRKEAAVTVEARFLSLRLFKRM